MKRIGLLGVIPTSFLFFGLTVSAQQPGNTKSGAAGTGSSRANVNSVAILRWYAANLTATFPVGSGPGAAAFDGSNMWVTNNTSNDVTKLRASDGAVLGKPPTLSVQSNAPRTPPAGLVLEAGTVVCTGAVVFAGGHLGAGVIVGDQAHVRERTTVGAGTVIGRGSAIDNDVRMGARVRIQTNVYVTAFSVLEDDAARAVRRLGELRATIGI